MDLCAGCAAATAVSEGVHLMSLSCCCFLVFFKNVFLFPSWFVSGGEQLEEER